MHKDLKDCNLINLIKLRAASSLDQHVKASRFPVTAGNKHSNWSLVKHRGGPTASEFSGPVSLSTGGFPSMLNTLQMLDDPSLGG